jgi:ABC-type antimicrobial peptide transport system permease subunit
VLVSGVTSLADTRRAYDESTAAWSLRLAVVVGVAGIVIALLVLLVIAMTTWRLRTRDYAALRMSGVGQRSVRRIARSGQVLAVLLGVVAGTGAGLLGARVALPTVPLFATTPLVSTLDLSTPWRTVGGTALAAALALVTASWLIGSLIARQARLQRVRESL